MTCVDCGARLTVRRGQTVAYELAGLRNVTLVGIEVRECRDGHREVVIPRIDDLHRVIAAALVAKKTLLAADEVRFLRKYLGFSQVDLAGTMGITPETVSRWESEAVAIPPQADRLIRVLVRDGMPVADYRLFDLLKSIRDDRQPARMRLSITKSAWQAVPA